MTIYSNLPAEIRSLINEYIIAQIRVEPSNHKRKSRKDNPLEEGCPLSTDTINLSNLSRLLDVSRQFRSAVVNSIFNKVDFWNFFNNRFHLHIEPSEKMPFYFLVIRRIFEIALGSPNDSHPFVVNRILSQRELLFTSKNGKPIHPVWLLKSLHPLLKWIGIREVFKIHSFAGFPSSLKEGIQLVNRNYNRIMRFTKPDCFLNHCHLLAFPTRIIDCATVENLFLSQNFLGALPDTLSRLTNLQYLSASYNTLVDVPESIGKLTNLIALELQHNRLRTLPDSFRDLSALKNVSISFNQLDALPESLGQLSSLQKFHLGNNQLTALFESFSRLTNLKALNLRGNKLTIFPNLTSFFQLRTLSLGGNHLTSVPMNIATLTSLEKLLLDDNQITDLPEKMTKLTKLRILKLHSNPLKNFPDWIREFQDLQSFDFSHNQLASFPWTVQLLFSLKNLVFKGNQLSELPEYLTKLTNLKTLIVAENFFTRLPPLVQHLTKLEQLDFSQNQITNMPNLFGLIQLRHLSLNLGYNPIQDNPYSFTENEIEHGNGMRLIDLHGSGIIYIYPTQNFEQVSKNLPIQDMGLRVFI